MSAPLLPLALAFALGTALGLEVRAPPWLVPVGLASAGLLLVTLDRRRRLRLRL